METQQVEYKKSFGKEVIISLVAFANSDGGKVCVGMADTGDIEKFGTGFVRIREYLREYPELSISVEEMGDFLKVALRINAPVTPPS